MKTKEETNKMLEDVLDPLHDLLRDPDIDYQEKHAMAISISIGAIVCVAKNNYEGFGLIDTIKSGFNDVYKKAINDARKELNN